MACMLVDRVIHRTFMLTAACANPMEAVFALLACAIQADVAVRARSGGDNTAERSEAIGRTVARRIKARGVSRAPAAMPGQGTVTVTYSKLDEPHRTDSPKVSRSRMP